MFYFIIDRHATMRPMSMQKNRRIDKIWITRVILKFIKTKNKLFEKYFKNKNFNTDKSRKEHYKKYLNKLTHDKNLAKRIYYKNLIKCNNNKQSQTWSIIKEIIDYENSAKKIVLRLAIGIEDKSMRIDTLKFAECFCECFANIGAKISKKLLYSDAFSFKIHNKS